MLRKLFSPITIGNMTVKNRIVYAATSSNLAMPDGSLTRKLMNFYIERAKGGAGLIIFESTMIAPKGLAVVQPAIYNFKFLPNMRKLVESVKDYGTKIAIQLYHAGRCANPELINADPVAPSSIICPACNYAPVRELTIKEIHELIRAYGEAACRSKMAGFDAVEILCGNYELIPQFLSPFSNKRRDLYGGSLEGRMRFALEVIESIKDKAGREFPIFIKINAEQEEFRKIAQRLEKAGVSAFEVTIGSHDSKADSLKNTPPLYYPRGYAVHLAEELKKMVKIPVIAAGRINDPILAEKILIKEKADLVALSRALIADPEFPRKAAEGRIRDIRKCIACNSCLGRFFIWGELRCAINPAVGREEEYKVSMLKRTENPKKVLIVGGGPAGMEAARVTSLRGHNVILYDKNNMLGGQLLTASRPSFKIEIRNLIEYLSNQVKGLGVKIVLNKEVDLKIVKKIKPDAVILATGASIIIREIRGVNKKIAVQALQILADKVKVGQRVLIVGGGLIGCEIAAFMAEQGKKVRIATRRASLEELSSELEPISRGVLHQKLMEDGVQIIFGVRTDEIIDSGAVITNIQNREKKIIEADTVILAAGLTSNRDLFKVLNGKVQELFEIGDCVEPRMIFDAINEASHVACII